MNLLDQLRTMTTVVVDTGEFATIPEYRPQDATTNSSYLLRAARLPQYQYLVKEAVRFGSHKGGSDALTQTQWTMDKLAVNFGTEILKLIPGRVSTEVDARLSFDTEATIRRAETLVDLYQHAGIDPAARVLFKIAATWEGIRAASRLEARGIHCNLTLLFSFAQGVACGEAGVTLVSPFVGRVLDWYGASGAGGLAAGTADPGVASVTRVYNYFKHHGFPTLVMGASFRNLNEVLELAGCDCLTIVPNLLRELASTQGHLVRRLDPEQARAMDIPRRSYAEPAFRWELNEDPMASEKLADGIRRFAADTRRLEQFAYEIARSG